MVNNKLNKIVNKIIENDGTLKAVREYIATEDPSIYELEKYVNAVVDLCTIELEIDGKLISNVRVKETMKNIIFTSVYRDFIRINIPNKFKITDKGMDLIFEKSYRDFHSEGYASVYSDILELLSFTIELSNEIE